jgi:hypothetical protein
MRKYLNKLFYSDKWNIGYVSQSAECFIEQKGLSEKVTWLNEVNADYSADPFAILHQSKVYIYYEELKTILGRGKINVISGFDFSTKKRVKGFEPYDIHLSYPYIFTDKETIYCIPETATAEEVALYQVNPQQMNKLTKLRLLIKGKRFVDSSIVFHEGRFWLFTSVSGMPNVFYIYHAATLEDEFVPHQKNPIATDNKNFRSAGNLFVVGNKLYRPTQNMEITYGGSVMINQITALSPDQFESEDLFEVKPKAPYDKGLHNISLLADTIVFDGKRSYFSPTVVFNKVIKKIINSL